MTFCGADDRVLELKGRCKPKLEALEPAHAGMLDAPTATGSLNVDKALAAVGRHEDHRYDYGIGLPRSHSKHERVVWIEVHGARTNEISRMRRKRQALRDWLNTNAPDLLNMTVEYVWVPTGRVDIPGTTRRRLGNEGLRLCPRPCALG